MEDALAKWERVYTINGYYDGPLFGVADYRGAPHVYNREFDTDADEYSPWYCLAPIEAGLLALVLEDWEIWLRWQGAYLKKEVSLDTHPALPEDRARHEAIKAEIGGRFEALKKGPTRAIPDFRSGDKGEDVCWRAHAAI
jgi:hypothetical protein